MSAPPTAQARIVLARSDRIGDVVITSSCFEPLQQALPNAEIRFLAQARMEPLFHQHPILKNFIGIPTHANAAQRIEQLTAQLRQIDAQCIVHFHSDLEVEEAAAVAKIPRRIGFCENGRKWLTESLPYAKKLGEKHEGFYNFDLLKLLGVPEPPKLQPNLTPDRDALARLHAKLPAGFTPGNYVVLHIGAHGQKPRIPSEFFIAAARWLVEERNLPVVLIGAERNDGDVAKIITGAGGAAPQVHNFCGQSDLAESAFLLRDAAVVFGRDSGPAHLAAAMGALTVTLMLEPERENSAQRWHPLGERSQVLAKPLERRWFESRPAFARRNLARYTPGEIIAVLGSALDAKFPPG